MNNYFDTSDLTQLEGKRVRYRATFTGRTNRVDIETMDVIQAEATVTVEGEVAGWLIGPGRQVNIAGYGYVDVDKVTVIEDEGGRESPRD